MKIVPPTRAAAAVENSSREDAEKANGFSKSFEMVLGTESKHTRGRRRRRKKKKMVNWNQSLAGKTKSWSQSHSSMTMNPMILMIPEHVEAVKLVARERLVVVVFGDTHDDFDFDDDDGCIAVSFYEEYSWTRPNEYLDSIKRRRYLSSHLVTNYGHHECFNRD